GRTGDGEDRDQPARGNQQQGREASPFSMAAEEEWQKVCRDDGAPGLRRVLPSMDRPHKQSEWNERKQPPRADEMEIADHAATSVLVLVPRPRSGCSEFEDEDEGRGRCRANSSACCSPVTSRATASGHQYTSRRGR